MSLYLNSFGTINTHHTSIWRMDWFFWSHNTQHPTRYLSIIVVGYNVIVFYYKFLYSQHTIRQVRYAYSNFIKLYSLMSVISACLLYFASYRYSSLSFSLCRYCPVIYIVPVNRVPSSLYSR